jgi:hypothetical protein
MHTFREWQGHVVSVKNACMTKPFILSCGLITGENKDVASMAVLLMSLLISLSVARNCDGADSCILEQSFVGRF